MNFYEYWNSLFSGSSTVAFIKTSEGKTIPLRIGDRAMAEHFWTKAGNECLKVVQGGGSDQTNRG